MTFALNTDLVAVATRVAALTALLNVLPGGSTQLVADTVAARDLTLTYRNQAQAAAVEAAGAVGNAQTALAQAVAAAQASAVSTVNAQALAKLRGGGGSREMWQLTDTFNFPEGSTGHVAVAIRMCVVDTASHSQSRLLALALKTGVDEAGQDVFGDVFQVWKDGQIVIRNTAGTSFGGIRRAGNAGEMALTSMTDPNSGNPADVIRWYWETTPTAGAAVIRGMGTNRLSIESLAAIVHIAGNGRYEWEGLISPRIVWISYQAASAWHRTIDISTAGTQDEVSPQPVLSLSVTPGRSNDLLSLGLFNGSTVWTQLARVDSLGRWHGPQANLTAVNDTGLFAQASSSGAASALAGNFVGLLNSSAVSTVLRAAATVTNTGPGSRVLAAEVGGQTVFEVGTDGVTRIRGLTSAAAPVLHLTNYLTTSQPEIMMFAGASTGITLLSANATQGFRADANVGRLWLKSNDHISFHPLSPTVEAVRLLSSGNLAFVASATFAAANVPALRRKATAGLTLDQRTLQAVQADGLAFVPIHALSFRAEPRTVSQLSPAADAGNGAIAYCTDLASTARGAAVTGGGSGHGFVGTVNGQWAVI